MESYFLTDTGKVRSHNEDSVSIVKNLNNEYLMIVADGMGGHKAGEIASSMVVTHFTNNFSKMSSIGDKIEASSWIRSNATIVNNKIFDYTNMHEESKGMGTTVVIAIVTNSYILFANVGDSSGYAIKNNVLYKVTKDHTLVNLLLDTGDLTKEQAETHPRKNVLMRALGANNPIEVDVFDVDYESQAVFLCSDGLTTMLSDDQIGKVLNSEAPIQEKVVKLIKKSNIRGGSDNISIAYLIKESEEIK